MEKAEVSESAKAKADTKRTPDGLPVQSFTTLLSDLATLTLNEATVPDGLDHGIPSTRGIGQFAPFLNRTPPNAAGTGQWPNGRSHL